MNLDEFAYVELSDGLMTITGEVDMSSAPVLRRTIDAMQAVSPRLDLSRVTFIDSSGLHLLIDLRHELGPLQIVAESRVVERLLEVTGTRSWLVARAVGEPDGDRSHDRADAARSE